MPNYSKTEYDARAEYLAARPGRLGSATLDDALFTADDDGNKILNPGLLLAKPSATDLWGPYDSTADDGREVATNNVLILHDYVDVTEGDKEVAVLLEGLAQGAKVVLEDGTAISAALKDALRSRICDVQFAIEST
jgi:hypothetical protein